MAAEVHLLLLLKRVQQIVQTGHAFPCATGCQFTTALITYKVLNAKFLVQGIHVC